jgi:hypothetical protein
MAFTESLQPQKGHFLSSPPRGHFFTFKKVGKHMRQLPPVPWSLINAKSGNIRPFTDFILRP